MEMYFCPLYSGSNGNVTFVQYGDTRILVDAGRSGKMITDALRYIGVEPESLNAILVTHEHSDHIAGAGVLARKYKLPIYATKGTWAGMAEKLGSLPDGTQHVFDADSDFYLGSLGVAPFRIPHDAMEPVGFRFYAGAVSAAVCTDLGSYTQRVHDALDGSDLVLLESNHDPDLVRMNIHYTAALRKRILSAHGHLSNAAAAEAVVKLAATGVRNVVLGHLSGENNRPELAIATAENTAELEGLRLGEDIHLDVASRDRVGNVYTLREDT